MFKLLKKLTKKEIMYAIICISLVAFHVWLELKVPDYMSGITRLVQTEGSIMKDIIHQGVLMMICALASLVCNIVVGYFSSKVASSFSSTLRSNIFQKVQKMGMTEIKKFSTSSLITRTTNDVMQVEMLIGMGLQAMVKAPIMAVCAILKILNKGFEWSILTACCVSVLMFVVVVLMIIVLPRFKIVQKLIDKINGLTRENLSGIRVIRAFNAEKYQADKFAETNDKLTKTQLFNQRCFAIMNPMMNLVMHAQTLGIYIIGAILIQNAGMTDKITLFSNMVVFSSYGMHVIMSFLMLALIFMMIPRTQISANRINEVLDEPIAVKDGSYTKETEEQGTVEFKNVSFKYPEADEYVLKDISFKVNKGETIAFIGSTGSGKSTLINLVPRFYDVTEGEVLVDGINVKKYKLETLNNKLGYVPQRAVMFTGSVEENIAYGKNGKEKITIDKVKEAVRVAQGKEFVEKLENTYAAHIARGGTNISGGQKQRLAIARAIARDPEIYIFDDSFSALDYKTDSILRKELKKYTKNATSLIVAQRIGTIINADKIVVLNEGECVGIGTHKELLKTCEVYREIAYSQLSKEELDNA